MDKGGGAGMGAEQSEGVPSKANAQRAYKLCQTSPKARVLMAQLWLAALPAVTALMGGRRDIVVITHGSVGAASEVRALAQCATAALHLRHGMRESARVWLTL